MNADSAKKCPLRSRNGTFIAVIAAVAGLVIGGWLGFIRDRVFPKKFGVVVDGQIYRSGQISSSLIKKILTQHKIQVIVNLSAAGANDTDKQAEEQAAKDLNIKVLRFPLNGKGTGDVNNYAGAITAIVEAQKNSQPVLVHCSAGAQRTGGIIAAYRLLIQKKDPAFVVAEMKRYGWSPNGNSDIIPYLNSNMAQLAAILKQAGVINEIPAPLPVLNAK